MASATPESQAPVAGCLTDPFSVAGLRRLAREDRLWKLRLRESRKRPEVLALVRGAREPRSALSSVLARHSLELFGGASRAGVEATYKTRQLLTHVVGRAGDVVVSEDGLDLEMLRDLLTDPDPTTGVAAMSSPRVSRALRLVMRAVDRWAASRGETVEWAPLPLAEPSPPRRSRKSLPIGVCARLVERARPGERVKLALAFGAGLTPGDIDRLRGGDLRVEVVPPAQAAAVGIRPSPVLWARARGRRRTGVRWTPLPPWVTALVQALPAVSPRESLFPPDTPSLGASVRRLAAEFSDPGLSPTDLCLTWQALALSQGLRRDVVRRTWSHGRDEPWPQVWHPAQTNLLWLATRWPVLNAELVGPFWRRGDVVPRRAPPGCPPHEPERGWRSKKREPAPMPAGVFG